MRVAIEGETLRWAAEVLTDQAIVTQNAEMAVHALVILDALHVAMEPQGAAKLCRPELIALVEEGHS